MALGGLAHVTVKPKHQPTPLKPPTPSPLLSPHPLQVTPTQPPDTQPGNKSLHQVSSLLERPRLSQLHSLLHNLSPQQPLKQLTRHPDDTDPRPATKLLHNTIPHKLPANQGQIEPPPRHPQGTLALNRHISKEQRPVPSIHPDIHPHTRRELRSNTRRHNHIEPTTTTMRQQQPRIIHRH